MPFSDIATSTFPLQLAKTACRNDICPSQTFNSHCFSRKSPFSPFLERVLVSDSRALLLKVCNSLESVPLTSFGPIDLPNAADPTSSVLECLEFKPRATKVGAQVHGQTFTQMAVCTYSFILLFVEESERCKMRRLKGGVKGPCSSDQSNQSKVAATDVLLTASSSRL